MHHATDQIWEIPKDAAGAYHGSVPPLDVLFSAWQIDWAAVSMIVVFGVLYALGLRRASHSGHRWPWWRTTAFYLLGLGSLAILTCGFTGVYGGELRWAFTVKVSLLLFVVPLLIGMGRPISLARAALPAAGAGRLKSVLAHPALRFFSNSLAAPLIGLALFSTFLTPAFHTLRTDPTASALVTILVPLVGLLMALPIVEEADFQRSSAFITLEFVFVFIELLVDAVPGILLRLNGEVLDNVMSTASPLAWFPDALRDQQLAGDALWFICEAVDLPLIILMFIRFSRSDKREARSFETLTDQQLAELNAAHLRRR
ncbi:cytochrome c oxidase assembly protein [Paenarthrobacter ilicis]|uniref:Cytochrome c oxidase assembly factor CtaG n=1 Tax=Paenarthrobacter ilicis TaxID=43665 RepID=A0ABX0TER8_9MICC|nr:cytochrome c oxidase assembly protein [Paenarthrobacter ilicis]MBM7792661.1 cytochrome c oxidase assembly factor CtaG [Paenarthrobacter ilicis]NIJ01004.1 cytochrome c oxidase assembly factor CtaG [Paenarthrobacter ilicis]